MACVKTLIEQEKGEEEIVNELCKYYASVSSLGHQEGNEETRKNWTDVDLLGRSGRANQQQNCIPYFTDYKTLRTLIFTQFFKKITFLPFLLLDCKARLKKNS
jgi:hypothetical protein